MEFILENTLSSCLHLPICDIQYSTKKPKMKANNRRQLTCALLRTMFPCFGWGSEQLRPVTAASLGLVINKGTTGKRHEWLRLILFHCGESAGTL